jgi:hypothetical protein
LTVRRPELGTAVEVETGALAGDRGLRHHDAAWEELGLARGEVAILVPVEQQAAEVDGVLLDHRDRAGLARIRSSSALDVHRPQVLHPAEAPLQILPNLGPLVFFIGVPSRLVPRSR